MTKAQINFLEFNNPTKGRMVFAEVLDELIWFMSEDAKSKYTLMIGSDSTGMEKIDLVSVIAIHRQGNGGKYFWFRQNKAKIHTLRQKIYAEVEASLELASVFLPAFKQKIQTPYNFQIHVDVGYQGKTRDLVREITGMVTGYGYEVLVKPDSAAATSFADRHVR